MKIAFFGSSLVSSYWNGAATYYRGLLKELCALGQEVTFYEPDAFGRQQHRDMSDPDWARVLVYPATQGGWQSALDDATRNCDLIVKASGVGVFDAELERAVPRATGSRQTSVYWDVDAPATLESMAADESHHLRQMIPHYDIVFTYGGGEPVISRYQKFGARLCVPIYNALDPQTHFPVPASSDYACNLSFLGNRLPDRERRVQEFLFGPARTLPEKSFLLGGSGWETKDVPPNVHVAGHVGSGSHNTFYCSGLATLNINRDGMARFGFSPPTRIFEAAGAGACIISDRWDGIEMFLEPGNEILLAENGEAVAILMAKLTTPEARRIGTAARSRILAEHTYAHRARQVMSVLDGLIGKSEAAE
jgi:spore maturation protein CgeB